MEASDANPADLNETEVKPDINYIDVKDEFIIDNAKDLHAIPKDESDACFGYVKEEPQEIDEDYKVNIHELSTNEFVVKEESMSADECSEDDKLMVQRVVMKEENSQMEFEDNISANIRPFYCKECEEEYQGYCPKCPMLSFILHSNISKMDCDRPKKTIPRNILEVRDTADSVGVYALRSIPKDVIFGPFEGLISVQSTSGNEWKIKSGKLVCTENTNWMHYVRCTENGALRNLLMFQCGNNVYYKSDREINTDVELIVCFCEGSADHSNSDKESYYRPVVVEDLEKVYACTCCCLGFNSEAYLLEHKMHCHMKDEVREIIQCSYCDIYLCEGEYLQHQKICSEKHSSVYNPPTATRGQEALQANDQCDKFTYEISDKNVLCKRRLHSNHLSERKYKCHECQYETKSKSCLQRHLFVHGDPTTEKQYKCDKCQYETHRKDCLRRHLLIHAPPKSDQQYRCDKCEYQTHCRDYLRRHLVTHHHPNSDKIYKCDKCQYGANHRNSLRKHLFVHTAPSSDKLFKCDKCKFETNYRNSLQTHLNVHAEPGSEKRYKCDKCQFGTNYKSGLRTHLFVHDPTYRQYKCDKCQYATHDKSSLRRHVSAHTDCTTSKRFSCDKCNYQTNRKSSLRSHLFVHGDSLSEKRYSCDKCPFKTIRKRSLQGHFLVHSNSTSHKRHKCDKCEYKTYRKGDLQKHLRVHTGDRSK